VKKARHTPGPWRARAQTSNGTAVNAIAQVAWCGTNSTYGKESQSIHEDEAFWNACLISALPEMYELLREMLEVEDMKRTTMLIFDDSVPVVVCRHCGREYQADDPDNPPPRDSTDCSDECWGYRARHALAKAAGMSQVESSR